MASVIAQPLDLALEAAQRRIARLSALPVLDPRLLQVLAQRDVDTQYQHLRELLRVDPALAVRVLKVANSAFYGSRSITSIDRALTVLGAVAVAGIAMVARFDGNYAVAPEECVTMRRHSLMTAVAAKALAARAQLSPWDPESGFVLGLLHDLGWLVHLQIEHERPVGRVATPRIRETDPTQHALLGAALLANWQLPAQFVDAVRDHHQQTQTGPASVGSALLAVAHQCALQGGDQFEANVRLPDSQLPLALFRITAAELPELGAQCAAEAALLDGLVN